MDVDPVPDNRSGCDEGGDDATAYRDGYKIPAIDGEGDGPHTGPHDRFPWERGKTERERLSLGTRMVRSITSVKGISWAKISHIWFQDNDFPWD